MKIIYTTIIEINENKYPHLTKKEIRKELIDTIDSYVDGQCIKETESCLVDENIIRTKKK